MFACSEQTNSPVAVWLEGARLVAILRLELKILETGRDRIDQHQETLKQLENYAGPCLTLPNVQRKPPESCPSLLKATGLIEIKLWPPFQSDYWPTAKHSY